jgi:hypothetical protein
MNWTAELARRMLHGVALPFRYHLASRRPCGSRLDGDLAVAVDDVAQYQASAVALGANGGLGAGASLIMYAGPVHYA